MYKIIYFLKSRTKIMKKKKSKFLIKYLKKNQTYNFTLKNYK